MVISFADELRSLRNIGSAMLAGAAPRCRAWRRVRVQRPMRAGVRLAPPSLLAFAVAEGFCPLLGGVLELSGVFGGRPSFASSSATRANSVSHCLVNAAIVSACVRIRRISVSLSSESSPSRVIQSLNQLRILQSNFQTDQPIMPHQQGNLSNYRQSPPCVHHYFSNPAPEITIATTNRAPAATGHLRKTISPRSTGAPLPTISPSIRVTKVPISPSGIVGSRSNHGRAAIDNRAPTKTGQSDSQNSDARGCRDDGFRLGNNRPPG